ncbi:hypothetical protein GE21DRAFT_1212069, partial [Neurospora crassa]
TTFDHRLFLPTYHKCAEKGGPVLARPFGNYIDRPTDKHDALMQEQQYWVANTLSANPSALAVLIPAAPQQRSSFKRHAVVDPANT